MNRRQLPIRFAIAVLLLGISVPGLMAADKRAETNPATAADAASDSDSFAATGIAQKLLRQLQDGLQARNSRKLLAAFDAERMEGYLAFKDQVESFFARHESFRVYLRVESASVEQDSGKATVKAILESTPRDGGPVVRQETELSLEFANSKKGWKIVDFNPRSLFS
jgi:hypothetical protein